MSILTSLALVSGAAYAFFSSSATSTGNVFASGSLILSINDLGHPAPAATVTGSFGTTGMKPGDMTTGFVSLDNTGTIDIAKIKLTVTKTASTPHDLADVLDLTSAKTGSDNTCTTAQVDELPGWITQIGGVPTLTQIITHGVFNAVPSGVVHGTTKFLCLTFTMDHLASNDFQAASTTETFSFEGDQDNSQ